MYARLRGVPEVMIADVVQDLINALLLQEHADKLTSSYRYYIIVFLSYTVNSLQTDTSGTFTSCPL